MRRTKLQLFGRLALLGAHFVQEKGKQELKKTDMFGSIPIMWALRYQARDDVIAKMIELYPKCVKVKNHKNMFAITYAHEYNASKAVIEL